MKITVKDQNATLAKDDTLVQNSGKTYIAEFFFDHSWDGFSKTAVFEAGNFRIEVPLTEDRCVIPSKCLERAGVKLKVGVCGTKGAASRGTAWCLTGIVLHKASFNALTSSAPLPEIPDDVRAIILELICASTATDEEVEKILNRIFGTAAKPPDISGGGCCDNTATDKEVEDILHDVFGEEP